MSQAMYYKIIWGFIKPTDLNDYYQKMRAYYPSSENVKRIENLLSKVEVVFDESIDYRKGSIKRNYVGEYDEKNYYKEVSVYLKHKGINFYDSLYANHNTTDKSFELTMISGEYEVTIDFDIDERRKTYYNKYDFKWNSREKNIDKKYFNIRISSGKITHIYVCPEGWIEDGKLIYRIWESPMK